MHRIVALVPRSARQARTTPPLPTPTTACPPPSRKGSSLSFLHYRIFFPLNLLESVEDRVSETACALAWSRTDTSASSWPSPVLWLSVQASSSPRRSADYGHHLSWSGADCDFVCQGLNDAGDQSSYANASDNYAYLKNPIWWAGISTSESHELPDASASEKLVA